MTALLQYLDLVYLSILILDESDYQVASAFQDGKSPGINIYKDF